MTILSTAPCRTALVFSFVPELLFPPDDRSALYEYRSASDPAMAWFEAKKSRFPPLLDTSFHPPPPAPGGSKPSMVGSLTTDMLSGDAL
eukprot:CAMPEP_0183786800 /NCGR_PEP_ID=MMETSP0739-20130205/67214_1 /TAXON_ID=385413 /ORGANISM="Thalassiosira miniscula, Strain CCMP1093" /LENGTH=88 /DNA_ID=CAMNT_0026030861 /DNA_START=464 /DNA_END=730 /DNA_ORIENTATION=+